VATYALTDRGRAVLRRCRTSLLADAGARGILEVLLVDVYGFTLAELAGVVHHGLATIAYETMRAGARTVSMTKLRITDAGRQALAIGH
jgi:hypothetical protein